MRSGYFPDFSLFRKQERNTKKKEKIFQMKFGQLGTEFFKFQNFYNFLPKIGAGHTGTFQSLKPLRTSNAEIIGIRAICKNDFGGA